MSLDSVLRRDLIAAGDSIVADTSAGIDGVSRRIRSHRNRRAVTGAVVVLGVVAAVLFVARDGGGVIDARPDLPPARERHYQDDPEREAAPESRQGRMVAAVGSSGPRPRSEPAPLRPGSARDVTGAARTDAQDAGKVPPESQPPALPPEPRLVTESYRVGSGTGPHMGENAGLGCTEGPGVTGSDDCFQFQVGSDETTVEFELVDDAGVVVSFHINEHHRGSSRALGSFCGATGGPVPVTPGSMLLLSIDGGNECSDRPPTTGRLHARFSQ